MISNRTSTRLALSAFLLTGLAQIAVSARNNSGGAGIFEGHNDVGDTKHAGTVAHDAARRSYEVSGGGANMWSTNDAFHFAWKKISGDVALAADISILGTGGDPHRKACLILRQSLDADSAYADAALHGDGLASLQYRDAKGARTYEVQANIAAPQRLKLQKRGNYISLWVSRAGEPLAPSGGSVRVDFTEPFYVGLAVCAHNNDRIEKAAFSNVELTVPPPLPAQPRQISTLEFVPIASKDRRVVCWSTHHFEAPYWSRDGSNIVFNSEGRLHQVPATGGEPKGIDAGGAARPSNHQSTYFASDRTGLMQIWRRKPDGSGQEQITDDDFNNWFPHPSPDGRWIVFLSYAKEVKGHPEDQDVALRIMPAGGGRIEILARLFGGEGTINAPSWSPDSRRVAFVSYQWAE